MLGVGLGSDASAERVDVHNFIYSVDRYVQGIYDYLVICNSALPTLTRCPSIIVCTLWSRPVPFNIYIHDINP